MPAGVPAHGAPPPLVYLPHGDDFAVVPANGGAERAPAWWLNLQAAGVAPVEHYQRRASRELPVVILSAGAAVSDGSRAALLQPALGNSLAGRGSWRTSTAAG